MVNGGYDMIDYLAIGKRIKRLRIQKHMTQEQLGNSIGLSAKHVSNIETNNAHPSLEALIQIANALECSLDCLCHKENIKRKSLIVPFQTHALTAKRNHPAQITKTLTVQNHPAGKHAAFRGKVHIALIFPCRP